MHESVMAWVKKKVARHGLAELQTLEIGSANVNGSVRQFFTGPYLGVDLEQGPGVDLVVQPGYIPLPDASFAVIVSTEALEHDVRPWDTLCECARLLRPGGWLLLTCRGFHQGGCFPFHNPPDRWRFSSDAMRTMTQDAGLNLLELKSDPQVPGWFLLARVPSIESATT